MSFTLGGPGNILPPRKQDSNNLGARPKGSTPGPRGGSQSRSQEQTSEPAFVEPDIKVRPSAEPTQLPQGTPSNVLSIARRRAKTLPQAVQSAIAQSGGAVIPIANIRTKDNRDRKAARDRSTTQTQRSSSPGSRGYTPSAVAPSPPPAPSIDVSQLCPIVFLLEAAKRSRGLAIGTRTLTAEQVATVAAKLVDPVAKMVADGRIPSRAYADCQVLYCKTYGCESAAPPPPPPPAEPPPPPPPAEEPPAPTPQPAPPPPPPPPPAPSSGGGGITPYVSPEEPEPLDIQPLTKEKKKPESSNTLWWLVALIAGGLLIKKLAAVKVVGAAMAGAPLIAELESESEGEDPEERAAEPAHESED